MKENTRSQFVDCAILHRSRSTPGEHETHVLHVTAGSPYCGSDVDGPFPSRLVGGAANGHAADMHDFEFPFFEGAHFIGIFETLQD